MAASSSRVLRRIRILPLSVDFVPFVIVVGSALAPGGIQYRSVKRSKQDGGAV
jgi:hypothetical protein